jgi:hypothetical protein
VLGLSQQVLVTRRRSTLDQRTELHAERHQPLLSTVMEVALDSPPSRWTRSSRSPSVTVSGSRVRESHAVRGDHPRFARAGSRGPHRLHPPSSPDLEPNARPEDVRGARTRRHLGSGRESTSGSPFWVVSRYDWSDPLVLRWTAEETSWGGSGTGSIRIAPVDGGSSRVHAEWTYTGASRTRDKVMLCLIHRFPLRLIIARGDAPTPWLPARSEPAEGLPIESDPPSTADSGGDRSHLTGSRTGAVLEQDHIDPQD